MVEPGHAAELARLGQRISLQTLTKDDLLQMKAIARAGGYSQTDVIRAMGVSRSALMHVGDHVGVTWGSMWNVHGRSTGRPRGRR